MNAIEMKTARAFASGPIPAGYAKVIFVGSQCRTETMEIMPIARAIEVLDIKPVSRLKKPGDTPTAIFLAHTTGVLAWLYDFAEGETPFSDEAVDCLFFDGNGQQVWPAMF